MDKRFIIVTFVLTIGLSNVIKAGAVSSDSILIALQKEKNEIARCQLYNQLGKSLMMSGKKEEALTYLDTAIVLSKNNGLIGREIEATSLCAEISLSLGQTEKSKTLYFTAYELAVGHNDTLLLANTLENLGFVFSNIGTSNYEKALGYYLQSIELKEKIGAQESLPESFRRISALFKETGDVANRKKYLLKAKNSIDNATRIAPKHKASVYNELGRFYTEEEINYHEAINAFKSVKGICEDLGWQKGIAVSITNIANVREGQKNYDEALKLHDDALRIKKQINDTYGQINSYYSIADVYYKIQKYDLAIKNYSNAITMATHDNRTTLQKNLYFGIYQAYKANNNIRKALFYFEQYQALTDSLLGVEHKNALSKLETEYETEKKEQRITELIQKQQVEELKAKSRQQGFVAIFIILVLLVMVIVAAYFRRKAIHHEQEIRLNQKLLRSQMNPHFIFNALNSINTYIFGNKPAEAGMFLSRFAKLMRNILDSTRMESITLEQEIETLSYYMELEQLRYNHNFTFKVIIGDNIEPDDIEIPPMLLQPFVENAIKHAFKSQSKDASIHISFKLITDKLLQCTITDNGSGIDSSPKNSIHQSHGIGITQERLQLINSNRKNAISVSINDLRNRNRQGTEVLVQIAI